MYNFRRETNVNNLYYRYRKNTYDYDTRRSLVAAFADLALDFYIRHSTNNYCCYSVYDIIEFMCDFTKSYRSYNFYYDLINAVNYHFN